VKNNVLDCIKKLSIEKIKNITAYEIFERGQEYASSNRVISFWWDRKSGENARLMSYVMGTDVYMVEFFCRDDKLVSSCMCPAYDSRKLCKHVVCALLTAEKLLHTQTNVNSKLLLGLLGSSTVSMETGLLDQTTNIYIKPDNYNNLSSSIRFHVKGFKNQTPISGHLFGFNSNLRKLFLDYYYQDSSEKEMELIKALSTDFKDCKVFVSHLHDEISINTRADHKMHVSSLTELNLDGDEVTIKQLIANGRYVFNGQNIRISEHVILLKKENRFVFIDEKIPWWWLSKIAFPKLWDYVNYANNNRDPVFIQKISDWFKNQNGKFQDLSSQLNIPINYLNNAIEIKYESKDRSIIEKFIIFKKHNQVVTPNQVKVDIVVSAKIDRENKSVKIVPQGLIDGAIIPIFKPIIKFIDMIDELPGWVRSNKRRLIIAKGLLSILLAYTQKATLSHIKAAVKNLLDTYDGKANKIAIHNYFKSFASVLDQSLESIFISKSGFYILPLHYRNLCNVAAIISNFFDNCTVECGDNNELFFSVPEDVFNQKLADFLNLLNKSNIGLKLNDKKLRLVSLDVSIDASRPTGSDWFDLDPKILSDGIKLTKEQRQALFESDGVIESFDCFKILDQNSQEVIKILAKIFQQSSGVGGGKNIKEIVQIPSLQILTLFELRKSGASIKLSKDDEEIVDNLTNFSKIKKTPIPSIFKGELRDYQKHGYDWLAFLYKHRFGACVADDMGLGKTVQAIAFLSGIADGTITSRASIKTPHLIVVPTTLVFNWIQELKKFSPKLKVKEYLSKLQTIDLEKFDIIITTYDRVRIDIEKLKNITFHVLILDEAQAIKNIAAGRSAAVRQLKSLFTISLTGTPLENHIGEYYSIIDVALPGLLPEYKNFMKQIQSDDQGNLIRRTKPFVLRRTKDAILKELPPKIENNVYLHMAEKQQKLYATTVREVKRLIDRAYESHTAGQANIIALTAILRLRQICISPQIIDPKAGLDSPKIEYLITALSEIIQENNAALVFSQFTTCLDIIEQQLKKEGINFFRIDGSTPIPQRKKIIETFQGKNTNVSVLLLSLKTGGVGLNLTRASYVYHIDPWWNPAVENQASDRAHRIGQKKSVFITRIVMHHTIEEKMMQLKEAKSKLFNDVMNATENKTKTIISKKDFDFLLE